MSIKKLISNSVERFDSGLKYTSVIGVLLTGIAIITIKVFDINVSQYLKHIPYIDYLIDIELIEKFENINSDDEYYIELQNNLTNLLGGQTVQEIKVRDDNSGQKTFRVMTNDGKYHYFIVTKDGETIEIFDQDRNKVILKDSNNSELTGNISITGDTSISIGDTMQYKLEQAYLEGERVGKENGYKAGYIDGKKVGGYDAGYVQGKEVGYNAGYTDGKKAGFEEGYNIGYKKGKAEGSYQAGN